MRISTILAASLWCLASTPVLIQGSSNDGTLLQDLATVRTRRLSAIIGGVTNVSSISAWISTLGANGQWPASEVNYATGCDAQRANWPASAHWNRIVTMAASYHGGTPGSQQWVNNADLRTSISSAMDWWFSHDYTASDCLYNGGNGNCPCGTSGQWNTNWFSNVILVPLLVAQSCMILNDTLTVTQASNCTHMTTRAYSPFYDKVQQGFVSGANILDMSKVGIDQAVRVLNTTLATEAYGRIHAQMVLSPGIKIDGIKPDGSFGQHTGLLYNGNYGCVFSNDVLTLEEAAAGTQLAASDAQKSAFASLYDGNKWMIYYNTLTQVLHWDFSALPRFITFPVADNQPTTNINTNLTQVQNVGNLWSSTPLKNFASSLSGSFPSGNAGNLVGNRMFYSNDYMVHRGTNYVTTLKMYSSRTKNTEYTNSQNPFGLHLADGTLYTYVDGSEYEDIAASWDWDKIPGITTDYAATPLQGSTAGQTGVQNFVGGASTGSIGVAAMRYQNPVTKAFTFQKAWFFLDNDVQHVLVNNITSKTSAPIISVLDQKRHNSVVLLATTRNGTLTPADHNTTEPVWSLWHDNVGYTFDQDSMASPVFFNTGPVTGNWSAIGTSTQPPTTVDLFSAWIQHRNASTPISYTVFPGLDWATFQSKSASAARTLRTLRNDGVVSAVTDDAHGTTMAVFWGAAGGSFQLSPSNTTLAVSANAAVIYNAGTATVTISDPSQTVTTLNVTISTPKQNRTLTFALPAGPGGNAGQSVTLSL